MAGLGVVLAVAGAWSAFKLGPSGEAQFRVISKAPGAIVVGPEVLNAVNVPVQITATDLWRGRPGAGRTHGHPTSTTSEVTA